MIENYGATLSDFLYFLTVLLKKTFNGQSKVCKHHINLFKSFGIFHCEIEEILKNENSIKKKKDENIDDKINIFTNQIIQKISYNLKIFTIT